jgi:chemotaxis protein methyltransferase CheR
MATIAGKHVEQGTEDNATREFRFDDTDFVRLRDLVKRHTGIALSDGKRELVYSRLARRLRLLRLDSFERYCTLLEAGNREELVQMVNAITTNLTAFFREAHHFDYLATTLLPAYMQEKARRQRLRVWSAGCSTGEEPYSMAMVVRETGPATSGWDIKILATDIDSNVLATARRGVYQQERAQGLSPQRLQRWFRQGTGADAGLIRVRPALQALITFRQLNLMHAWPMRGPFDVIFCRNVVIYFDKATQKVLFDRFADLLDTHGVLCIGHSESLYAVSDRFALLGQTIYRKCR